MPDRRALADRSKSHHSPEPREPNQQRIQIRWTQSFHGRHNSPPDVDSAIPRHGGANLAQGTESMINTLGHRRLLGLYSVLCTVFQLSTLAGAAQPGVCDPVIEKLSSGTLPYKFIGPQCEGTYSNPTGGKSDLQLVALTKGILRADFRAEPALNFEWTPPPVSDVRLRATSTRYKYYYQMDA